MHIGSLSCDFHASLIYVRHVQKLEAFWDFSIRLKQSEDTRGNLQVLKQLANFPTFAPFNSISAHFGSFWLTFFRYCVAI